MREVIEVDLDELDLRKGVTGAVGLGIALALVWAMGTAAVAAGIAALLVVAGEPDDSHGPDGLQVLLVLAGAVVTLAVGYSADSALAAGLVIGLVTVVATLVAASGPRSATAGTYALLWAVLALGIGDTAESAAGLALSFAIGGCVALLALWLVRRVAGADSAADEPVVADEPASDRDGPMVGRDLRRCPGAGSGGVRLARVLAVPRPLELGRAHLRPGPPATARAGAPSRRRTRRADR